MSNDWINEPLSDEDTVRAGQGITKTFAKRKNSRPYYYGGSDGVNRHGEPAMAAKASEIEPVRYVSSQAEDHEAHVEKYTDDWFKAKSRQ